jgi:hypothetical protein
MCYTMNDITLKHPLQILFPYSDTSIMQKRK